VAPQAKIAAARLIGGAITDQQIASALLWRLSQSEISNNSWGPTDGIFAGFSSLVTNALQQCAVQGRSGKGRITVFAAGNGGPTDNSNYDGVANSRYVIAVGAITDLGIRTFYSEPGANILICAPSNGGVSGIYTTDLIGSNGYNSSNASIGLDYTDDFGGTSSASPAVAGVCALLLKQNPNLGWRDVKEILLSTATRVAASDSGWRRNGGGFYFNEFYGAGLVNAKLAVQTATNWTNLPPEISLTVDKQNLNTNIPDANVTGITTEFSLATGNNFRIEHVELHVGISHTYRGDLDIKLISPSGMESQLKRVSGDSTNDLDWTFSSVQFWGENPAGIWKLVIRDLVAIDSGKLLNAKLTLYGAQPRTTPPVIPPVIVIGGGSQVDTAKQIVNLSTRAFVNTGEGVEIGGIVVEGSTSKRVLIRALGPSLSPYLANFLKDPTIEVRNQQGTLIASNDDWKNGDLSKISQSGLAPSNNLEPALLLDLNPGNYTVIVKGYLDDVGVALVECYDLDGLAATRLANISTRASVGTGDNVTIAGFIIQGDTERNVVIRGIGPSLTNYGIVQALLDPMIELHDTNGDLLMSNDNWADTQRSLISGTGLSPVNTNESAIYVTLKPGSYTVILKGKNDTMGTGLVEVYEIR
jgi:subtilisin-like proprotein convertase family protein